VREIASEMLHNYLSGKESQSKNRQKEKGKNDEEAKSVFVRIFCPERVLSRPRTKP
jgi:hypothetical protein